MIQHNKKSYIELKYLWKFSKEVPTNDYKVFNNKNEL